MVTNTKRYVPAVTLSISNIITFLEHSNQRFNTTISWIKYRTEITTQPKNNNLDYMIYSAFSNINGNICSVIECW